MFCFWIEEDPSEASGVSTTSKSGTEHFVWLDEEQEGAASPKKENWRETEAGFRSQPPSTCIEEDEGEKFSYH